MADVTNQLQAAAGYLQTYAWNIAAIGSNPALAWNISKCVPVKSFSVSAQDTNPRDISFKSDGTKMYILGGSGDDVNEYNLSTPWLVSTASYVQNFSVAAQESQPQGLFFKPDGTKMYICGLNGIEVNEYNLSTAWNISTASFVQLFSVSAQETAPRGLSFKTDGTKMYVTGSSGDDVNEYNLSTPWDISTASFVQAFSISAQETTPNGIFFKPDGTKMYISGDSGDDVNQYDLGTAWDVSTASFVQNFSVAATAGLDPSGVFFKPDGTAMYIIDGGSYLVFQYLFNNSFSVAGQETVPRSLSFKPDGTKMYVMGSTGDDVNEYDLSTSWDISTASFLQVFSVAGQETVPEGLFFRDDGTKMYVVGSTGDDVNEYTLSSAWNVSTASYVQVFSVAAQETVPTGVFFKSDGTKMYISGSSGDDVNEYNLSTAWNISTASYLQNFSVSAQTSSPQDLYIRPNGGNFYIVDGTDVDQYSIGTAWNISTSTFQKNYGFAGITDINGLFFKPDGTIMYIVSAGNDTVYEFYLNGKG